MALQTLNLLAACPQIYDDCRKFITEPFNPYSTRTQTRLLVTYKATVRGGICHRRDGALSEEIAPAPRSRRHRVA
jgi:hypothetical protein